MSDGRKTKTLVEDGPDSTRARKGLVPTNPDGLADAYADKQGPLPLIEDADTGDRFLIYQTESGVTVELQLADKTFWASQRQIAEAFGVTPQNISFHLINIFREGELDEAAACKESLHTGRDGKRYVTKLYNLNALTQSVIGWAVGSEPPSDCGRPTGFCNISRAASWSIASASKRALSLIVSVGMVRSFGLASARVTAANILSDEQNGSVEPAIQQE